MFKKIKPVIISFLFLVLLATTSCEKKPQRFSASFYDVFDTVTEFTAYCADKETFDSVKEEVYGELLRLHRLFDIYNSYEGINNIKTINDAAGTTKVTVDPDITSLLKFASDEAYFFSKGKLNVALGSVLKIWHEYREKGDSIPSYDMLLSAYDHCDIGALQIDGNEVSIKQKNVSLDVGAIAKGYSASKAAEKAISSGITDFALNVGGNVVTSGKKPDVNEKWKIGIEDPDGGFITTVKASGVCVVTSGDYQRYYEYDGKRYCHIIDTDTLFPAELYRSVTVICNNGMTADALSTALFCIDTSSGKELLKRYNAEAIWLFKDGTVDRSEGFSAYEK